jgi:hypothetical protein
VTKQPIHPLALLRQSRSSPRRLFSTAARRLSSFAQATPSYASNLSATRAAARTFPASATRTALSGTTHAPFASPLRPNLTGGTLSRTAGGYGFGGGARGAARHFSHVPAAQAQVVQNVSQAVRAFCLQGYRPQYQGLDHHGSKRFVAVSQAQAKVANEVAKVGAGAGFAHARGTTVEFRAAPVVAFAAARAFSEATGLQDCQTLSDDTVMDMLAAEFDSVRKSMTAIQADLKRLATLGSLPLSTTKDGHIQVRFPGCDGASVERLCIELGVQRGIVREDAEWVDGGSQESRDVEMALLFPWAPDAGIDISAHIDEEGSARDLFFEATPLANEERRFGWESMMTTSPTSPTSRRSRAASYTSSSLGVSAIDEITFPGQTPTSARSSVGLIPDIEGGFQDVGLSDVESEEGVGFEMTGAGQVLMQGPSQASATDYEGIYRFLSELDRADRR